MVYEVVLETAKGPITISPADFFIPADLAEQLVKTSDYTVVVKTNGQIAVWPKKGHGPALERLILPNKVPLLNNWLLKQGYGRSNNYLDTKTGIWSYHWNKVS